MSWEFEVNLQCSNASCFVCVLSQHGMGVPNDNPKYISLQTVPLQSIMHELDKCFILDKGTVWRDTTDI